MISQDEQKKLAGYKAVEFLKDGMIVGLGTGSTAKWAVEAVAENELDVVCVPTSIATRKQAEGLGISLKKLHEVEEIDITIDGADQFEVESGLCIKGGGGAHYIEKQVAKKSRELIIIADESKLVESFRGYKVPLEVDFNGRDDLQSVCEKLGFELSFRDVTSDSGNSIADVVYDRDMSLAEFEIILMEMPGVIDTGIFNGLATKLVVARGDGSVEVIDY